MRSVEPASVGMLPGLRNDQDRVYLRNRHELAAEDASRGNVMERVGRSWHIGPIADASGNLCVVFRYGHGRRESSVVSVSVRLRGEWNGPRSGKSLREPSEHHEVGVEAHAVQAA
jgi:hypothetical protein